MSELISVDLATLLIRIAEVSDRDDCRVRIEESTKGYISYHFMFDFDVDKYESFIILNMEDNSVGSDKNDYEEILNELEEIVIKADRLKQR